MSARKNGKRNGKFSVAGPGLDEVTYETLGPAISRSLTAALASLVDGTWYVRDLDGTVRGYSERIEKAVTTVAHGGSR